MEGPARDDRDPAFSDLRHPDGPARNNGADRAKKIAEKTDAANGVGTVTGAARTIRRNAMTHLENHAGIDCGHQDVVENDGYQGYRLREWIKVRWAEGAPLPAHDRVSDLGDRDNDRVSVRVDDRDNDRVNAPANVRVKRRREWIIAELDGGRKLRVPDIAKALGCSEKTAQRDLGALRTAGKIDFTGSPRGGHYRLKAT